MKSVIPVIVLLMLSLALHVHGQVVAGSMSGVIRDSEGAVIPDAAVTVKSLATGRTFMSATDSRGRFRFAILAVGEYEVKATKENYQAVLIERYSITLGSKDFVRIEMQAATEFAETITISGDAPLIETTKTTVDTVIENEVIDNLPLFERDFLDVLTTLGGVTENNEDGQQSDPGINISGGRTRQNIFQVDGGSNSSAFNGKRQQFYNLDVIEEVQLSTANFEAQYGRGSGGVVNVVTKSGTNDLSGSFSFFLRDSDLNENARNEWNYQEYSFLLGGPIIKDKLFFLVNASRVQRDDTREYLLAELSDVYPNDTYTDKTHRNAFFGKLTWYPADNQSLNATLNYEPSFDERYGINSLDPVRDGYTLENGGFAANLTHTWNLSESYYTQTFLNIRNIENSLRRTNENLEPNADLWFVRIMRNGVPTSTVAFDGPAVADSTNEEFGVSFSENLHYFTGETSWGTHSFTAGFSFDYASLDAYDEPYNLYVNFFTVEPPDLARYGLETIVGDPEFSFDHNVVSAFGQDSWQAGDRLTINLGARVDYDSFLENTDFSPRIGLAFDPTGNQRTVFRAGAGIYYAQNFFELHRKSEAPKLASVDDYTFSGNFDLTQLEPDRNSFRVREGLKTPYTVEANVGIQHQVAKDVTVSADFVWRDMKDQFFTIYENLPSVRGGRRPDPNFNNIIIVDNAGHGDYKAFTLGLNKRLSDRWMLRANYTWSRSRGNSSRFQSDGFSSSIYRTQAIYESWLNGEGPLAYDLPHQFKVTGIYMMPWDVTVSAYYLYRSGYPLTVVDDLFVGVPIPINTERLPDYKQLDIRLYKAFGFGGHYKLAFYVDFINALNTENIIGVSNYKSIRGVPNPDYLKPTNDRSYGTERETQIGLKIEF